MAARRLRNLGAGLFDPGGGGGAVIATVWDGGFWPGGCLAPDPLSPGRGLQRPGAVLTPAGIGPGRPGDARVDPPPGAGGVRALRADPVIRGLVPRSGRP